MTAKITHNHDDTKTLEDVDAENLTENTTDFKTFWQIYSQGLLTSNSCFKQNIIPSDDQTVMTQYADIMSAITTSNLVHFSDTKNKCIINKTKDGYIITTTIKDFRLQFADDELEGEVTIIKTFAISNQSWEIETRSNDKNLENVLKLMTVKSEYKNIIHNYHNCLEKNSFKNLYAHEKNFITHWVPIALELKNIVPTITALILEDYFQAFYSLLNNKKNPSFKYRIEKPNAEHRGISKVENMGDVSIFFAGEQLHFKDLKLTFKNNQLTNIQCSLGKKHKKLWEILYLSNDDKRLLSHIAFSQEVIQRYPNNIEKQQYLTALHDYIKEVGKAHKAIYDLASGNLNAAYIAYRDHEAKKEKYGFKKTITECYQRKTSRPSKEL